MVDAIQRTDMDLRKSLYGSIVLSGGSTLTRGFGDRLLHEVQRLAVRDMRIKIFAPPERKYTTWTGGSILAGLSTFKKVSLLDLPQIPGPCMGLQQTAANVDRSTSYGSTRMNGRKTLTLSIQNSPNTIVTRV